MHRLLVIGVAALAALALSRAWLGLDVARRRWSAPAVRNGGRPVRRRAAPGNRRRRSGRVDGPRTGGRDCPVRRSLPTHGRGVTIQTEGGYAVASPRHVGGGEKGPWSPRAAVGTMGSSGTPEHPVPSVHLGIRRSSDAEGYVDSLGLLPARAAPAPRPSEPAPTPAPAPSASPAGAASRAAGAIATRGALPSAAPPPPAGSGPVAVHARGLACPSGDTGARDSAGDVEPGAGRGATELRGHGARVGVRLRLPQRPGRLQGS